MPIVTTSNRKRPRRNFSLFTLRSSLAIAAVVIVAAIAVYLGTRAARPRQAPPKVSDTAAKPASTAKSPAAAAPSAASPTAPAATPAGEPPAPRQPATEAQGADSAPSTNEEAESAEQPPPASKPPELPETALKLAAEQFLAFVIGVNEEAETPPPPAMDERQLRHDLMIALTNDIVIFDDETPENQRLKENIAEAKMQLKEIMDKGGSLEEAIEEYRAWKRENIRMRREVRAEYVRLRREATREEADAYLKEANKALEAEGVQPIEIGPPRRKKSVKNGDPRPPKPEPAQEQ